MSIERACIYCRGSDDLAFQAGIAAAFIADHQLKCSDVYVDEQGFDSWQKIAEDCARGGIDAVVIQKADILTENYKDLKQLAEILPIPIIGADDLYCSKENLDLETLQYEKSITGRRKEQKRELDEYRQAHLNFEKLNGYYGGLAPFGYSREDGKLVHDPTTSSMVERIFTMARDGEKITDIAAWLDSAGIPTSRDSSHWSDNTVKSILRNSVYVDDLITRDLYDSVQERFDSKAEAEKRESGVYQGIIRCGTCGRPLAYHGVDGKDRRKTAIYSCKYHTGKNPKEEPLPHMPKIEEEKLKAEVLRQCNQYILGMTENDRLMALAIKRFENQMKSREEQMRKIGQKVLEHKFLYGVKIPDDLWSSWELARRRYVGAVMYRTLLRYRASVHRPEQTIENDFDQEKRLYRSITISPEGKVNIEFLGDTVFGWD